ncbi:DUF4232 domain-containing protein [Amycolatopsis sp. FDAARGOS 1241]|uniref:DUF4232 domain-containing protein n=1 Tax=Amycolatopsis sp. FDAARGOS 1241 TaxID=2778070 RepID=UPI00194E4BEC|nr:DUF4232 domain-containing protein [Amycolatopsis sp. FDAARGOS 1241]QRP49518.1 DUF4232 domain-containing protein [Amycolatopsis sp. FDAARGOS 1241]
MRVTTVATVVSFAALAVSLTACTGTTGGSASPDQLVARNATASASAPASAPATSATPTTTAKPPAHTTKTAKTATAADFHAELTLQPDESVALLTLENRGKSTITVSGSPELRFLGGDGSPLDLPIRKVDIPGPPTGVTLKPGTAAFAGVKWTLGDKADPDALVANNFELTPPGATGTITVDLVGTDGQPVQVPQFPIKSVQVGTLQPARQGVLVF